MKVLIEVKDGIVQKCYSTNKDAEITVLDYDNQDVYNRPDIINLESELLSAKEMREKINEEIEVDELADLESND